MVVAAAVLAAALGVVGVRLLSDDSEAPRDTEPSRVRVVVDSRLESGSRFSVRYEAVNTTDAELMGPPVALELRRDGEAINSLITLEASGEPPVQPPGAGIPLLGTRGHRGPFEFTLPELRPGRYQLCGYVTFGLGPQRQHQRFCRTVQVVAR